MAKESRVTLADVICNLRQMLLEAAEKNDSQHLVELATTFDSLTKAVYQSKDRDVASILETMESFARYSLMGVAWKVDLPSAEAIRFVFSQGFEVDS